ncbi:MAG: multicopper oxidase domain-containing protein [Deltaproteobacteria bacterium]|nr:multicopper oxidase domain-containing protein [Deltaproteobacteria bacterium]
MNKRKFLIYITLLLTVTVLSWGVGQGWARPLTSPGGQPDYFETPNWANSPPLPKFVDPLPGLWDPRNGAAPAKSIPLAVPDTLTYPGSDYYEIELREYSEVMHSSMPATRLRGYVQVNNGTNIAGTANDVVPAGVRYLGPLIVATKNRPVRIKFTNKLPTGASGNLFIPVDTTVMGSGAYEINYDPVTKAPSTTKTGTFSQNRADLHLHGGRTPWISDGTPHQWITPNGEVTDYAKGVSVAYVPDMWFTATGVHITDPACAGKTTCATAGATNNPGAGSQTYYYTNQQSARLMFYHDHAWGITRLNVYVGMAAGYMIQDAVEQALIAPGKIPSTQIPLIIQDKTFVNADTIHNTVANGNTGTDPTWNWGSTPGTAVTGDLWWPHVYMPAENPYNPDMTGSNPMGRWFYGPWFFPATPLCGSSPNAVPPLCITHGPVTNAWYDPACVPDPTGVLNNNFCQPPEMPGTPNVSWGAEAFLDTMMVNGAAYPTLTVDPKEYRFRVLNAAHDRFLNLQLYQAVNKIGYTNPTNSLNFAGALTDLTEVAMVPAAPNVLFPATWPTDGREGGVPNPNTRGPAMIQIGTEGGFLPTPVVLPNQPITWNYDPTTFNFGNVNGGTLILGPAERADVIVDFTKFAGQTLILYNDAPTAFPALVPQYDYYTGAPDRRDMGGANTILPGVGPNIRTVMQIVVTGSGGAATPDDYNVTTLANLQTAIAAPTTGAFAVGQEPIVVGQTAYNSNYGRTFPRTWPNWGISRISDTSLSFQRVDGTAVTNFPMQPKAIHDEMGASFDDYGRMAAKLGLEVPFTNAAIANFVLQNFVDPATEIVRPNQVQIWKITHNGVDTHPIHFHLFDVQVINRAGWDGLIRLPDANELGWKDTVRISPLEDTIVAFKPIMPTFPFAVPDSVRPLNPASPIGSTEGFSQIDTLTGGPIAVPTTNQMTNFGNEYVWHCHILSHEENDMMRPIVLVPEVPRLLWVHTTGRANLWKLDSTDNLVSQKLYGPFAGWTPVGYYPNTDSTGGGRLLWVHTSGQANLWKLDATDNLVNQKLYGPFAGWTPVGFSPRSDGTGRLLWKDTSGQAQIRKLDATDTYVSLKSYGPFAGWTPLNFEQPIE